VLLADRPTLPSATLHHPEGRCRAALVVAEVATAPDLVYFAVQNRAIGAGNDAEWHGQTGTE